MNEHRTNNSFLLSIAYINIQGQTGLNYSKESQIESFIRTFKPDIIHFQEINVSPDTFENSDMINSNLNLMSNNATNKYGTASLISAELEPTNIKFDAEGRIIVFDLGNFTFGNIYFPSGVNLEMRNKRENFHLSALKKS